MCIRGHHPDFRLPCTSEAITQISGSHVHQRPSPRFQDPMCIRGRHPDFRLPCVSEAVIQISGSHVHQRPSSRFQAPMCIRGHHPDFRETNRTLGPARLDTLTSFDLILVSFCSKCMASSMIFTIVYIEYPSLCLMLAIYNQNQIDPYSSRITRK